MKSESSNCCSGCSRPDLPWAGRGTGLPISGCRFTLYPMTDNFIDIILGALKKTDTQAVWSETDALSTVYRGKLPYVTDAVKALFINAYQENVHMAIEGQFSKGCPGDISGDSKLEWEGEAPNKKIWKENIFRYTVSLLCILWGMQSILMKLQKCGIWRRMQDFIRQRYTMRPELTEMCRIVSTTWSQSVS